MDDDDDISDPMSRVLLKIKMEIANGGLKKELFPSFGCSDIKSNKFHNSDTFVTLSRNVAEDFPIK